MSFRDTYYQSALTDFQNARRKAALRELVARLTGKPNELLSYDEVAQKLKLHARYERGIQEIPLDAIVGSVGRYSDFTRDFLPRKDETQRRWAQIRAMMEDPASGGIPPIDVYKVGEVYFVLDGNHRVSAARQAGFKTIEAHVIEVKTDIPLTPDISPDDLIIKAEYADFLEKTGLKRLRPEADLSVSVPGQYQKLLEHIEVHRYFMGIDFRREIAWDEAVAHWYDTVYLPVVEPIREHGLLRWFPGRTETDLYLWVSEHRAELESETGWSVRPEAAALELAARENPRLETLETQPGQYRLEKMSDRYLDRLFRELLVPITGTEESWQALEQAIHIARIEQADLHGLHIIPRHARQDEAKVHALQHRFQQRCQEAGVNGNLAIRSGAVAEAIRQHALLADLIVLNVAHPPLPGLSALRSGLRTILRRAARPVLAVPGAISPLDNALLAFDGSENAHEALFIAAYLAEVWKTRLTVLTATDHGRIPASVQDSARAYLELHEVQACYLIREESKAVLPRLVNEYGVNLVIMGSYGGTTWREVLLDSAVNFMLREARCPVLICH